MTTQVYRVEGMTCGHCAGSVTTEVSGVAGVENAVVDLDAKTVTVTGAVSDEAVAAAVAEAGYTFAGRA
ncbi:heavy-metal-associated domain-containing protein [Microbacterium sp. NC79]|uniref:heavy-metal-associated domain-containing protein n=1 Tax=Microbacterium sp. NC79 TaxID=2851009 RepID=UPI001C2CA4B1|nr:heavy-metal-associated domain-containing protein [Microbacterium sp. NC79]MBV0895263.1 heavy-metal-associated domain-containing protein [Microbacterium sp. NC79]